MELQKQEIEYTKMPLEKQIQRLKSTKKGRRKLAAANRKKRAATRAGKQHAKHGLHKGKKR